MASIIHAKAFWEEPRQRLKRAEAPTRSARKPAGSHIADLVSLGKAINLCRNKCLGKFNAPGNGYAMYREVTGLAYCHALCDGCRELTECNTFLKLSRI